MLIAQQKRKDNIAEYLLYMFQIEDLIRAHNFDIERIEKSLISQYDQPYEVKRDMREWYQALIGMMKENNFTETGHIPLLSGLIDDLTDLHQELLNKENEQEYKKLYEQARPAIEELKIRSGSTMPGDIEVSLNGLYGLLILRLQQKKINPETEKAFEYISEMIAHLASRFHQRERGTEEI